MDIVAEGMADEAAIRAWVRKYSMDQGIIVSEAKNPEEESVYEMYYDYREPAKKMPPHRILAINRGERENILKVSLEVEAESIHRYMARRFIKGPSVSESTLLSVIDDAYKRLLAPSIEREVRAELTEKPQQHSMS
ncbi:hypothetical protein D3C77_493720 [compost metagenome]